MKPKHQRLIFVAVSMAFLLASALLTLRAFRDNLIFFYSPSELAEKPIAPGKLIRVGGLVENGSIERATGNHLRFVIGDGKAQVRVHYQGMLPGLFREGQGVVAEGYLKDGQLTAKTILAKHDENYMPREVVDSLKRTGRWQGAP